MATKIFWLPIPHLKCVIRHKCRNPEYVIAVDTAPIDLHVLAATDAPVYARSQVESNRPAVAEDRYHVFDDALWRPLFFRQLPLLAKDFAYQVLADISQRLEDNYPKPARPDLFGPERPYLATALRAETAEGYPRATRILDTSADGVRETLEANTDDAQRVRDDLAANLLVIDGAVFRRAPEPIIQIALDWDGRTVHLRSAMETESMVTSRRLREPNKRDFHQPWLDFALHELDYAKIIAERTAERLGFTVTGLQPSCRMAVSESFIMSDGPFACGSALQLIRRAHGLVEAASHVIGTFSDDALAAYMSLRGHLAQAAIEETPFSARALGQEGERKLSAELRQFCSLIALEPANGRSASEPYFRNAAAISELREHLFGPDLDPELADLMV